MAEIQEKKGSKTPLFAAVIVFLILIFAVGFIYGLNSVLAMEGSFPPNVLSQSKTPLPDTRFATDEKMKKLTKEDILEYISSVTDYALTSEGKISYDVSHSLTAVRGEEAVSTDGSESFLVTLKYLAEDVSKGGTVLNTAVRGGFEPQSTDFGEDMSKVLRVPQLTPSDIESFEVTYVYYACPSCGVDSKDRNNECFAECPDCGSVYGYQTKYENEYTVILRLKNTQEILNKNFAPLSDADVKALFSEGARDSFTVNSLTQSFDGLTLEMKISRAADKLIYMGYGKNIGVNANVTFTGKWETFGTREINVGINKKDGYSLTWPGLSLNAHTMTIAPKGTNNLLATLVCADPTSTQVTWTSSAPDIVEVDEEGYLTACKEDGGSAIITAQMEFNGKTYSDSCEVFVRNSVESTEMKKNKVKLGVGDSMELEVKISPKNATVQTLKWYSEDESKATVDENGRVTAVSKGRVTVYSISDDGYFKSSCEVSVE